MDLSAIIFVVLAVAWAVYLIPKALKHHDEMASDRLVEGHSDKVRILSRHGKAAREEAIIETEVVEEVEVVAPAPIVSAGRKAARRRRRVLGLLVLVLAVVWTLDWFAYLPFWSPVVPGALVVGWLVLARLSVRKANARRRQQARPPLARPVDRPVFQEQVEVEARVETSQDLVDLLAEDTVGVPRQEIEAALADDGSLWDPLPLTLPTYVNKARARRTVRTIELTGINSSGHDQADSTLAREAAESTEAEPKTESGERKAAGA